MVSLCILALCALASNAAAIIYPLPGYYADPNIAVYGSNYYLYPTTDGFPGWGGQVGNLSPIAACLESLKERIFCLNCQLLI